MYDGRAKAPDIRNLPAGANMRIWVLANSVLPTETYAGREACLRQVTRVELAALWDYDVKFQSKHWSPDMMRAVMSSRLASPPAKMIRHFVFAAGDALQALIQPSLTVETEELGVGMTRAVPFSPLEEAVTGRVKAAQTDNAEVDLSHWAPTDETPEEARARLALRRLALRWWKHLQIRQAKAWLEENPGQANEEGVEDCIQRISAATYWSWPRGSRILFCKVKDNLPWLRDFRDGVKYWKLAAPPKGNAANIPSPSRETELLARLKVFQLRYQRFIYRDDSPPRTVIPRFLVPKVVSDDGTILDVRCVWDCRRNGHNETLYSPGFMLPTVADAEDQVVKWLAEPVAEYLRLGCPTQVYTQDTNHYIKSVQGDIDIGKCFNNFRVHPDDQDTMGVRYIYTDNAKHAKCEPETEELWKFSTCCFGNSNSPFICCQGEARLMELAKGDPALTAFPLWSHI